MTADAILELKDTMEAFRQALIGGHAKMQLFTGESGAGWYPVLIGLESTDTTDELIEIGTRVATAFERIATVLETVVATVK